MEKLKNMYIEKKIKDDYPFEILKNSLGDVENFCKKHGLQYSVSDDYHDIAICSKETDLLDVDYDEDFIHIEF